jgi:hypothetical protein
MANKKKGTKKRAQAKKVAMKQAAKTGTKEAEKFWQAVRSSPDRDEARQAVLAVFPRETFGRAGLTARRLSEFRSFRAAHDSVHDQSSAKTGTKSPKKESSKKRLTKEGAETANGQEA